MKNILKPLTEASKDACQEAKKLAEQIDFKVYYFSFTFVLRVKAFWYQYNITIYTFSCTMPPLESLSYSQVHICIITVQSSGGL